jgi:hypothetical protein
MVNIEWMNNDSIKLHAYIIACCHLCCGVYFHCKWPFGDGQRYGLNLIF